MFLKPKNYFLKSYSGARIKKHNKQNHVISKIKICVNKHNFTHMFINYFFKLETKILELYFKTLNKSTNQKSFLIKINQ